MVREVNVLARDTAGKTKKSMGIEYPEYVEAEVECACGNKFKTMSTKVNISVDICSKCHPFFTGKQKFVDSGGRVEKFNKRFQVSQTISESK